MAPFIDSWIGGVGVSRTKLSLFWASATFIGAPLLPFFGAYIDRHGVSASLRHCLPLFGAPLLGLAIVSQPWQLWVAIVANRVLVADLLLLMASVCVNSWFVGNAGKATALMGLTGPVMACFPGLASWLILGYGRGLCIAVYIYMCIDMCMVMRRAFAAHRQPSSNR